MIRLSPFSLLFGQVAFGVHNGLPFVIDKLACQDRSNREAHCAVSQSQVEDQHESEVCHKVFVQSGSKATPRDGPVIQTPNWVCWEHAIAVT